MEKWLPTQIVDRVIRAHPPCEERGEDKISWKLSSDGRFTVKSTYQFLFASTGQRGDNIWRLVWKWQVPEKMKTFMWLMVHDKLHTNQLRARRGLDSEARCPFGCQQDESVMHLIRDCSNARRCWEEMVDRDFSDQFFSLQGVEWIRWNLKNEIGKRFTKKLKWSILFGYICWDIWVTRCRNLFNEETEGRKLSSKQSFFRACSDANFLSACNEKVAGRVTSSRTNDQDTNYVRLRVDGSVMVDGRSGCGGYVHNHSEEWISGFSCKLSNVPPVIAELIGIIHGLNMCWQRGFKKVKVISDCVEAINLTIRGCDDSHPFKDVIDDVRLWVHRNWQVKITHVCREENLVADQLAKISHSLENNFRIFDSSPF